MISSMKISGIPFHQDIIPLYQSLSDIKERVPRKIIFSVNNF